MHAGLPFRMSGLARSPCCAPCTLLASAAASISFDVELVNGRQAGAVRRKVSPTLALVRRSLSHAVKSAVGFLSMHLLRRSVSEKKPERSRFRALEKNCCGPPTVRPHHKHVRVGVSNSQTPWHRYLWVEE